MKMEMKNKVIRRCMCTPTGLHIREAAEGEEPSRTIIGYAILFNVPSAPLPLKPLPKSFWMHRTLK